VSTQYVIGSTLKNLGDDMTEEPKFSRKQRRVSEIKRQIVEAAAELFAEKGFHRTTTKDIANAAGVSEGTIYNYFNNKDDLLLGIMDHLYEAEHLDVQLLKALPEDAHDFLESVLKYHEMNVAHNNAMIQSVLSEILVNPQLRQRYYLQLVSPIIQQLTDHILAREELGQIRSQKPQYLVRMLISLTFGLFLFQVFKDDIVLNDWDELSSSIANILFEGVKV